MWNGSILLCTHFWLRPLHRISATGLPYVTAAYNSSVHEAHGFTRNFLTSGRHLSAPFDVVLGNPSPRPLSPNDYADHMVGFLSDAYEEARAHLGRSAERNKRYYDYWSRPVIYSVGDRVWVYSPRRYRTRVETGNGSFVIPALMRYCAASTNKLRGTKES